MKPGNYPFSWREKRIKVRTVSADPVTKAFGDKQSLASCASDWLRVVVRSPAVTLRPREVRLD